MTISMERWIGKVAVVTGASSGIGAAITEQLILTGVNVIGLARRKHKLDDLADRLKSKGGKFYPVQADLTKEEDILNAFKWIKNNNIGPVHILINNAGVTRTTNLTDGDTKLWKEVFDTNVLALCIATREAIKNMKENNVAGHIIHINSCAGHKVTHYQANVYGPSKYAVTALTETLRQELSAIGSKIKVTSISPGYTETDIIHANFKASGMDQSACKKVLDFLKDLPKLDAEDVVDSVIYVLSTPPHVQVHELTIKPVGDYF